MPLDYCNSSLPCLETEPEEVPCFLTGVGVTVFTVEEDLVSLFTLGSLWVKVLVPLCFAGEGVLPVLATPGSLVVPIPALRVEALATVLSVSIVLPGPALDLPA